MSMSDPMAMLLRPLTPEKGQLIQMEVERGYKTFLSRVAIGRDMSVEAVTPSVRVACGSVLRRGAWACR